MNNSRAKRPGIVTVLAVCQFLGAPVWLLLAAGAFALATQPGATRAASGAAVAIGIAAILQVVCGVGLWTLKPYGRTLQIAFACIGLVVIPFGTVVAILVLLYLFKPGVRALFAGKPLAEFSPDELKQLAPMGGESGVLAAVIAGGAVVASFFVLGIASAIAVPSFLSARMTGNEVVAVSRLRDLTTAELAYASACGHGAFVASADALSMPPDRLEEKNGFRFSLDPGAGSRPGPADCHGRPTVTAWYATAVPITFGSTGRRSFATNGDGAIWQIGAAQAPSEPFGPPAVRR